MSLIKLFIIALILISINSCSVNSGIEYAKAPKPSHSSLKNSVYIIHYGSTKGDDFGQIISIDGKYLTTLPGDRYTWLILPTGKHIVFTKNPLLDAQIIDRKVNQSSYDIFVNNTSAQYYLFSYIWIGDTFKRVFKEVSPDVGKELLRKCKYIKNSR